MPNNHKTIIFIMAFQDLPRNFSRIVKIIHSVDGINPSLFFDVPSLIEFPGLLPPFIHEERKHEGLYGQTASLEDQDCRMWG